MCVCVRVRVLSRYGKGFGWTEGKGSDVVSCYINLGPSNSDDGSTNAASHGKQAASSAPSSLPVSSGTAASAGPSASELIGNEKGATAKQSGADTAASDSSELAVDAAVINHTPPPVSPTRKEPQHAVGYVSFFVNGEPQGVAFSGIQLHKKYYPYLSLYNGAEVRGVVGFVRC